MTQSPAAGASLPVTLSHPKADRVKGVAALTRKKSARSRAGLHVAEGPQAVREAVRFARVRDLYVAEGAAARHADIVAEALTAGLHVHGATDAVVDAMSPDAQGILATVHIERPSLDDVLTGEPRLVVVLMDARDPGNLGTIIRTTDAAGADAVVLAGDAVEPTNPKVVRAAAGSLYHVPVVQVGVLADVVDAVRKRGLTVAALDGNGEVALGSAASVALVKGRTAWLLGNEARGLNEAEAGLADVRVVIPMRGRAESLNLAAAAAVALFADVTNSQ